MQEKASSGTVSRGAKACRLTLVPVVDFRCVVDDELDITRLAGVASLLTMRGDDAIKCDVFLIEQTIRGLAVTPRFGLFGSAAVRPRGDLLGQLDEPPISPHVAQFTGSECHFRPLFRFQNDHRSTFHVSVRQIMLIPPNNSFAMTPDFHAPEVPQRTSLFATSR